MKWMNEAKLLVMAWIAIVIACVFAYWLFLQLLYSAARWMRTAMT